MNWEYKVKQFLKDNDKKALFLINLRDGVDEVAHFLSEYLQKVPNQHLIVLFNIEIQSCFARSKLNVRLSEDYLSRKDYEAVDNHVLDDLSTSWYLYNNATNYREIQLGQVFEYELQRYLMPRIKNLEIIRQVINKENIQKIIAIEDSGELNNVAKSYANFINVSILEISFNRSRKLYSNIVGKVRSKLSILFSTFLDRLAFRGIKKLNDKKGLVLIDAKLWKYVKHKDKEMTFVQCPLDRGTGIRFNLITKGFSYLPFYFIKNRRYSKDWIIYKKRWESLYSEKEFRDIFRYKDIPIWEIVHGKLSTFFLEDIPRMISDIDKLDEILKEKKIKIAVLRNDSKELERTIIFCLRLSKIPSLVIQHGVIADLKHHILLADKFAAWGKASVDWYNRFGNPPEKFEVTGNPHFDTLVNWRPKLSRQTLCKQLNLDPNKGIILFATQQINKFSSFLTDDLFWVMADKVLTAMKQFPDKQLIIKADPYEDVAPYRERISAGLYNNAVAVRDVDIYTLIFMSELVIVFNSTVGLEAMVFDKPLITVNLTKREDTVPFAEKGAALGVYEEANLIPAIKQALSDPEAISGLKIARSRFIEEYAYGIDGKASERISNLIKYLLNEKSNINEFTLEHASSFLTSTQE